MRPRSRKLCPLSRVAAPPPFLTFPSGAVDAGAFASGAAPALPQPPTGPVGTREGGWHSSALTSRLGVLPGGGEGAGATAALSMGPRSNKLCPLSRGAEPPPLHLAPRVPLRRRSRRLCFGIRRSRACAAAAPAGAVGRAGGRSAVPSRPVVLPGEGEGGGQRAGAEQPLGAGPEGTAAFLGTGRAGTGRRGLAGPDAAGRWDWLGWHEGGGAVRAAAIKGVGGGRWGQFGGGAGAALERRERPGSGAAAGPRSGGEPGWDPRGCRSRERWGAMGQHPLGCRSRGSRGRSPTAAEAGRWAGGVPGSCAGQLWSVLSGGATRAQGCSPEPEGLGCSLSVRLVLKVLLQRKVIKDVSFYYNFILLLFSSLTT
ncbi:spidroin-1-like isoform X1 [Manacus candei]|uniref:spidroin-1-like isoform X1 n=1 Tax=Manacus candei TaxID=415023 RepID=UPI002226E2D9|nr:spidroin-1-like isoform X1 [Manacus candei]